MTTLSSKKSSFTVAGNENSITQAQQYSGICLRNKLTVINNQNNIIAQQRSPSSSPFAPHSKTGPVPTGPKKFRENGEGRPEGWFAALYPRTLARF